MSDPLSKISGLTLPPVILCIGSDRVLGDALGPITGELLKKKFNVPAFVYGSLSTPVNALNLGKAAAFIASRHRGAKIVAIDGSVGSEIGKITVSEGSLRPGLASGKVLPAVGDVSITVTVATDVRLLPSVRLGVVYDLALKAAGLVADALAPFSDCGLNPSPSIRKYNTRSY